MRRVAPALVALLIVGCRRHGATTAVPGPSVPTPIAPGIEAQEVAVTKLAEHPRLWIYIPKGGGKHLPCVFIAAAGSNLVTGMTLNENDRAEHVPYVEAGYVVVAYDVSGPMPKPANATNVAAAIRLFAKRHLGIDNGKSAIDYALKRLPIDPMRLYAVGHSSAGTLALQLAAADSRIRGVVAYAPVTDVPEHLGATLSKVQAMAPEVAPQLQSASPLENVEALRCPTMLFTAEDDPTVPTETVQAFGQALLARHRDAQVVAVASGGHYDSMIDEGIPAGIKWLSRDRRTKK